MYYTLIAITTIMVEVAIKAVVAKNQTIKIVDARHNLSMQLSAAKNWEEVVSRVLQYPASVLKVTTTTLMIYDQSSEQYILERSWSESNGEMSTTSAGSTMMSCCADDLKSITTTLHSVDCNKVWPLYYTSHDCFHLLLNYGDLPVGIIVFTLPKHKKINQEYADLLSKTAEDMAIGLSAAKQRQEQHVIEMANAASTERLEIARDLHDTLGQNLGYLHFKLDQILTENNGELCQAKTIELKRLRDLADESYELVRNTLVILHHRSDHRIRELLNAHTQIIAKRTGFSVKVKEEGISRAIPPEYLKQLLHAYKEAIFNIEKHSGASEAKVSLSWTEQQLNVRIWDNGKGFDMAEAGNEGHYGLHIITERIQSIGGKAEISSSPGIGTEVMLSLPLKDIEDSKMPDLTSEL